MDKEFLFIHARSLWRGIETEGRAFPANTISIAVSGFGDLEHGVQGIQGFLVPGAQSHGYSPNGKHNDNSNVLGKRRRNVSEIVKFFPKKEGTPPETISNAKDDVEPVIGEPNTEETYDCPHCLKSIPLQQLEEHDDYHVALELSKGSPARPAPIKQLKAEVLAKEETRGPKKKGGKPLEKGQKRLEFGT
jgi:Ubiquitin-Binding Zinc Finger